MSNPATGPAERERIRRMRIRLAALKRHAAARDPLTGKSTLAMDAGRASGRKRIGNSVWGLESCMKRWHAGKENHREGRNVTKT